MLGFYNNGMSKTSLQIPGVPTQTSQTKTAESRRRTIGTAARRGRAGTKRERTARDQDRNNAQEPDEHDATVKINVFHVFPQKAMQVRCTLQIAG